MVMEFSFGLSVTRRKFGPFFSTKGNGDPPPSPPSARLRSGDMRQYLTGSLSSACGLISHCLEMNRVSLQSTNRHNYELETLTPMSSLYHDPFQDNCFSSHICHSILGSFGRFQCISSL